MKDFREVQWFQFILGERFAHFDFWKVNRHRRPSKGNPHPIIHDLRRNRSDGALDENIRPQYSDHSFVNALTRRVRGRYGSSPYEKKKKKRKRVPVSKPRFTSPVFDHIHSNVRSNHIPVDPRPGGKWVSAPGGRVTHHSPPFLSEQSKSHEQNAKIFVRRGSMSTFRRGHSSEGEPPVYTWNEARSSRITVTLQG